MLQLPASGFAVADPAPLVDPFGRAITYLRVSVTDRCDFRCVYCMSEQMQFLPKRDLLTLEELDRLCTAFVERGTRKLRITGGEPLVRRGVMGLFRNLSRHLKSGGYAILAGLLATQERMVLAAHRRQGLVLDQRFPEGQWTALLLRKPG